MRKDVKCTFGILKGRWLFLRLVFGCMALRELIRCGLRAAYWLLEIDGLLNELCGGVPVSDWDGQLGELDFE